MIKINQQPGEVGGIGVSGKPGGHGNAGFRVNNLNDASPGMGEFPKGGNVVPPVIGQSKISV
jgi:hypothetical protein